jgi:hypothetical protein
MVMKINRMGFTGLTAVIGFVFLAAGLASLTGCDKPSTAAEVGEKTGAALDTAAEKTVEATKTAASATKEFTGKALEETGEAMKKAGEAMENTGENMQK